MNKNGIDSHAIRRTVPTIKPCEKNDLCLFINQAYISHKITQNNPNNPKIIFTFLSLRNRPSESDNESKSKSGEIYLSPKK